LTRAGVAPRRLDEQPEVPPFFNGAVGVAFAVGRGGELRVFIFADTLARVAVTARLDPFTAAPRGGSYSWPSPPLLAVSQNLIAVMLGGNSALRERVQLAIEAGLPSGEDAAAARMEANWHVDLLGPAVSSQSDYRLFDGVRIAMRSDRECVPLS